MGSRGPPPLAERAVGAGGAPVPVLPQRRGKTDRPRSPTPDYDEEYDPEDDDDMIEIDSD